MPSLPDITPAQWKVTIGVVAAVAGSFGLNLSSGQQAAMISALVGLWSVAHLLADAVIRHGRATGIGPAQLWHQPAVDPAPPADGNDTVVAP